MLLMDEEAIWNQQQPEGTGFGEEAQFGNKLTPRQEP